MMAMTASRTPVMKGGEEELSGAFSEPEEGAVSHILVSVVSECCCQLKC